LFTTSVSGPGQKRAASAPASAGQSPASARGLDVGDVDDERIRRRAALRREDAGDGVRIQRVRAQAVHRFGREGDEFTRAQPHDRL